MDVDYYRYSEDGHSMDIGVLPFEVMSDILMLYTDSQALPGGEYLHFKDTVNNGYMPMLDCFIKAPGYVMFVPRQFLGVLLIEGENCEFLSHGWPPDTELNITAKIFPVLYRKPRNTRTADAGYSAPACWLSEIKEKFPKLAKALNLA